MSTDENQNWHLDRKVPIGIILAILFQTFGIVIWGTKLDSRVGYLESQNVMQDKRLEGLEGISSKVAVMESRQLDVIHRLDIQTKTMQEILGIVSKHTNP